MIDWFFFLTVDQMLVELRVVDDPEKVGFYSGVIVCKKTKKKVMSIDQLRITDRKSVV